LSFGLPGARRSRDGGQHGIVGRWSETVIGEDTLDIIRAIDKVKTKLEWELQDQKYKLTAYSAEADSREGMCSS
jgi:hypothetical protein